MFKACPSCKPTTLTKLTRTFSLPIATALHTQLLSSNTFPPFKDHYVRNLPPFPIRRHVYLCTTAHAHGKREKHFENVASL